MAGPRWRRSGSGKRKQHEPPESQERLLDERIGPRERAVELPSRRWLDDAMSAAGADGENLYC
jgi:hypothetical protein